MQDPDSYLEHCLEQLDQKIDKAQQSLDTKDLENFYTFLKDLITYICSRDK